uniref:Integrase core domain containing protein n=1 Tax=Solanum tuberosum TaxID=4113 RepID=M0ZRU7_SOLTU
MSRLAPKGVAWGSVTWVEDHEVSCSNSSRGKEKTLGDFFTFDLVTHLLLVGGVRCLELICVDKLAEHPYFTRSKAPKDSFPNQSLQKGKTIMGDNNEEIGLTDVVVAQPTVADQNELILQLMQQITEMRVEIQRRQNLPNPIFSIDPLRDGRPPLPFSPPNAEQVQNPPSNPA